MQRIQFNTRFRHAGGSVATNVAELRSITQTCKYSLSLDKMLRDRIVCGINDDRIQQRLLSEKGLTYKKALELSQGLENSLVPRLSPRASDGKLGGAWERG